jgi:hypothetical protein
MVQGLCPGRKKRVFSSPKHPDYLWGPLNPLFNGYWGSLLGAKWPWSEVNYSLASSAKVKNEWSYTSTPPDCLKAWTGTQFTFMFTSASIIIITTTTTTGSWDGIVGIETRYGLEDPAIKSRWGEIFRTYPDWLRGPPSPLYNGYRVFPGGKGGRGVMLTTHPLLVPRLRNS